MSHNQQLDFVSKIKNKYKHFFKNKCVLEVGSLNINGTVRSFFENCAYIGLDVAAGPCVDVVCLGHEYDMPDGSFDTVISCECFEHDPYYIKTFNNMIRLVKSGGLIIFSCATAGRKEHGTINCEPESSPLTVNLGWNYYKNLEELDFKKEIDFDSMFSKYEFIQNMEVFDLYFYGVKK